MTGVTQWKRIRGGRLATALMVAVAALTPALWATAADSAGAQTLARAAAGSRDEVYPTPPNGVFVFHGRGNGHGHGMSQWGAYGAAKVDHLSANQILHFYYPHTTLATRSTARTIRVLLSAADAASLGYLTVNAAAGLTLSPADGKARVLPTTTTAHKAITGWRLQVRAGAVALRARSGGSWHTTQAVGPGATFTDTAMQIPVVTPGGEVSYRGSITGEVESGSLEAVNTVNLELYLRSVVPAEMPSSWTAAALQAQAVAARTYARHGLNNPKASWFDVFGDTRDQAYAGVGREATRTTRAIEATAGEVIVDAGGHAVLAQYAAADGGWTVSGGVSYLPAKADPYDGAVPNSAHAWTRSVPARTIAAAYPQLGAVKDIDITGRDGHGRWGGRVTTLTLVGSKTSVAVSGTQLQAALGFGSPWFRPTPRPSAPLKLAATASGQTVTATWKPPQSVTGAAKVTGYRFTLSPGGHHQSLNASTVMAKVTGLAPGVYTVAVVALSAAGNGPSATVTVTVAGA